MRLASRNLTNGRITVQRFGASYGDMCEWFDETCGLLLEYLDEKQLGENTLLIYVADNGWTQLAEHSNQRSFAERSKRSPYEKSEWGHTNAFFHLPFAIGVCVFGDN